MPVYQENYTFELTVDGANYWPYLRRGTLTIVQGENNETGSLTCQLEDYDDTLSFLDKIWKAVYFKTVVTEPALAEYVFGGLLVQATPEHAKAETRAVWTLKCESWATLFPRLPAITKTYTSQTCKAIIADLFATVGLTTGWDVTTYVATGDTIASFECQNETLDKLLMRLVALANVSGGVPFTYWLSPTKQLKFGPASAFVAPFSIVPLAAANWTTSFPPLRGTTRGWEMPEQEAASTESTDRGGETVPEKPPIKWY